jgi:iron complex outermembrane recepter protein
MKTSFKAALLAGTLLGATVATAQTGPTPPPAPTQSDTPPANQPAPEFAPGDPTPLRAPFDSPTTKNGSSEIVVTGIRNSLASSARIKRDANQILDSITATDIGKFPDANIAESLQRITGVAIDRSGGEGQFITVRGLGPEFNTVLVNGRVMATDNPGREFSFDVLSSNMIQRTDVYKSSVPELREGGIGATVNIITARPLEAQSGFHIAASAGGIYDTLRGAVSPDLSAVTSLTNEDKTIGIVLAGSYTDRRSQLDYEQTEGWIMGPEHVVNGSPTSTGLTPADLGVTPGVVHVPQNVQFVREEDRRKRINFSGAFQVKPTDRLLITLDGVYSKFDVYSKKNIFANFFSAPYIGLQTDATGTATGFNRPGSQFLNNNPALTDPALGDQRVSLSQNDNIVSQSDRLTQSYIFGANVKWDPLDDFEVRLDASKTEATQRNPNEFVVVGSLAQTSPGYDLNPGGDVPIVTNSGPITDPSLMRAHYTQVGMGRVKDRGQEYHIDLDWKFHDSIFRSIQAGAQYAERHKVQRNFNNDASTCAYCGYEIPIPTSLLQAFSLNNFLPGVSGSSQAPKSFFTYDPNAIIAYLSDPATLALARQGRTPAEQAAEAARLAALPGGVFSPQENLGSRLDVRERVVSGYMSIQFGGDRWGGNAGVRVVHTSTLSRGYDQPVISVTTTPGDDTLQYTYGPATPVSYSSSYLNALPSANVKYNITSKLLTRAAFSQTVTRPTLTDLSVSNSFGGRIAVPQSSGGNPLLKPFKSTNYDLSLEWYPSRVTYVSVGAFYKNLNNFLELQTLPVERFGRVYQDTRTRNGQSGYIRGVEIGGQYSFDHLPGWLSGFGVTGNYTYVDSKAKRDAGLADYDCGYNGLSPHSANGSVFYEKYGIGARVSYNWRSDYLRACRSDQSRPRNRSAYGQMDFNVAYDLTPHIQFYVQGVNVLNTHVHEWSAIEERFLLMQDTGSRYIFGARVKF